MPIEEIDIDRKQRVREEIERDKYKEQKKSSVIRKEPKEIEKVFWLLSFSKLKVMFRIALVKGRKSG